MAFYFDAKIERKTSYANQRSIAIRDLGTVTCAHGKTLNDEDCFICRASGGPLIPVK